MRVSNLSHAGALTEGAVPSNGGTPLRIVTLEEQHQLVLNYLKRHNATGKLKILEAGCGRRWKFELPQGSYTLVGVDLDRDALEARKNHQNDLHEVFVGDLRDISLDPGSYDIIYSSYVLEHIGDAERVLDNFLMWLKPGGLLILYVPDPGSVYGFLSKHTPHWLHVCFYRYLLGRANAGKPGNAPYPTVYDDVVSREGIREFASNHDLDVREECGYYKPPGAAGVLMTVFAWLSLGRLAGSHCDLLYILQKREHAGGAGRRSAHQQERATSFK